ncbi:MAG: isoleucyl-tRNA synthetase [Acidimicrobiaceae bacterium]|nr:isoleucyl-tRNA synthetase [Acidimicrobiaceae bacterium]
MEEAILDFWEREAVFEESIAARSEARELVVYDGPPFANGLPHYGHLLTGFVKDAIPRYKTMQGYRVERRFGWDCHGLPAETAAEKELGVSGRQRITEFGIGRFNDYCRKTVLRYTDAWKHYVTRQGRWVDFEHDYKTMDLTYMESVLWAFKTLHDRGLVYEGYKVLPFCWECETPLSNFETRQDDAYRERVDPAVTVTFELLPDDAGSPGPISGPVKVLVWTTTPWTLPSNLALAVGPDLDYAVMRRGGDTFLVGAERATAYAEELEGAELVGNVRGAELVGRRYRPMLPYFADTPGAFVVLGGDFVATDEGTGVVHMSPGFGEDDQRLCEANAIPVICPVDDRGRFDARVPDYAGMQVFEANERIIERLDALGVLVRREEYAHSYPHCWRTDTPLIYRAVSSFFVEVTAVRDRMIELNEQIDWVPENVRHGAFGRWLEGARDWAISRNRFWGTPIPVWKSDDPAHPRTDVYGSLDELERDFGVRPSDLHRPAIDELTRPNPDDPTGRSTMRRVTDVLDGWFDSGSMPFAQLHYPFENAERFESHFPADFICEYVGQTRGWFYTLHVLATALFDRPAFSHCVAHGVVLGDDGRKLSKRLRNYPDPEEVFAREGADAMRWYLCSSPVLRGQDVVVAEKAMSEPIRQVLNPIWNSWYFLSLYGRSDNITGTFRTDQEGVLDRYVLAKTSVLVEQVTASFDAYDLPGATAVITDYLDALTNWYVRRSRGRFWRSSGAGAPLEGSDSDAGVPAGDLAPAADDADKRDAYDTLHTALSVLCRVAAPLLPFLTESVYKGLTGDRSVHLADWPDAEDLLADPTLVEQMDLVRAVCSAAHSIRKARGLRSRLPLARLTFAGPGASALEQFSGLIADEVNVREVVLVEDVSEVASTVLTVVPATLGPRLGPRTQQVINAVRKGEWTESDGTVTAAGEALAPGEYALRLRPLDDDAGRVLSDDAGVVVLELELTPELEAEGAARDLVRLVQQARKDAGLHVADRIELQLELGTPAIELLERWRTDGSTETPGTPRWQVELANQTLAVSLEVNRPNCGNGEGVDGTGSHESRASLGELGEAIVRLRRADSGTS